MAHNACRQQNYVLHNGLYAALVVVTLVHLHLQGMKKNILKIDSAYTFLVSGIVTPMPEYKLCWNLNHVLLADFYKTEDLTITIPELHVHQNFSRFVYQEDVTMSTFWVLQNKYSGDYLLPEVKQADYILLIKGTYYINKLKAIEKKVRTIAEIQTTITLDVKKLKNKERLLF